ncbi:hypothetical protein HDU76_006050, partial [Blyttiomyces sp. JEL0837]
VPIEVNTGDTVVVKVTNGLAVPTSLHWHGMLQNGSYWFDGPTGATQCAIAPNETYTYKFSTAGQEGTYWWHGHCRTQYVDGLRGPFIIRNLKNPINKLYHNEQVIELTDWYHDQSEELLSWYLDGALPTSKPKPNPVMLNDNLLQPVPALYPPEMKPTDIDVEFRFSFDTKSASTSPTGIADRYQKAYPLIKHRNQNIVMGTSYVGPQVPTLVAVGANKIAPSMLPKTSNVVEIKRGQVVQLTIINVDAGEHPFHLHGHVFWVMASGIATKMSELPIKFPTNVNYLRRDTFAVPACPNDPFAKSCKNATDGSNDFQFGYAVIRYVSDNPGVWVFHCHIEWHIAAGLVMTFVEVANEIQDKGVAAATIQTCASLDKWVKNTGSTIL